MIFRHSLRIRIDSEESRDDQPHDSKSKTKNLTGRINNLATSDVSNITSVTDFWIQGETVSPSSFLLLDLTHFIYTVMFTPLQIFLSILFLYVILGWRYVPEIIFEPAVKIFVPFSRDQCNSWPTRDDC